MREALPDRLFTARCTLRPFHADDFDDLFVLYGDPAVMAMRKIGVQDRQQTGEQLRTILSNWNEFGLGYYTVRDTSSGAFLGECGLRLDFSDAASSVALSYGLVPTAWGQGFATEVSVAVLDAGFTFTSHEVILAFAKASNSASLRVLDKLGFARVADQAGQSEGVARSELTRDAWQTTKTAQQC